jgi:hypothetical protein
MAEEALALHPGGVAEDDQPIPEQIGKFAAEHGYTRSRFLLHAAKRATGEAPRQTRSRQ